MHLHRTALFFGAGVCFFGGFCLWLQLRRPCLVFFCCILVLATEQGMMTDGCGAAYLDDGGERLGDA